MATIKKDAIQATPTPELPKFEGPYEVFFTHPMLTLLVPGGVTFQVQPAPSPQGDKVGYLVVDKEAHEDWVVHRHRFTNFIAG